MIRLLKITKMNNTIQQVSEDTLKLVGLFSSAEVGREFTFKNIEDLTGIKMDERGKGFMRSALKKLKMPYENIRGHGICLLSPENASRIVVSKVVKVDNSIKRAAKTTKQVSDRVYDKLSEEEKKNINFLGALFGTIRAYSTSAKRIFSKPQLKVGEEVK